MSPSVPRTEAGTAGRAVFRASLLALLCIGGCATRSGPPVVPLDEARIEARDQRLADLDRFAVSGGFSYWDDERNLTAGIDWQQDGDALTVRLRAPLGLGRLDIEQRAQGARVARTGSAPLTGPRAAPLLSSALGLAAPVPLEQLGDWVRGLPGSGSTQVTRDEAGRLKSLVHRDATGQRWRAQVRRYREVDGVWLPALLTAVSAGRHLKLALKDWRLSPSADALEPTPGTAPGTAPGPTPGPTPGSVPAPVPAPVPGSTPAGRRLSLPGA